MSDVFVVELCKVASPLTGHVSWGYTANGVVIDYGWSRQSAVEQLEGIHEWFDAEWFDLMSAKCEGATVV